jgi:hypothetical protein
MIKTGSGTYDDKERKLPSKKIEKIAHANDKKAKEEQDARDKKSV